MGGICKSKRDNKEQTQKQEWRGKEKLNIKDREGKKKGREMERIKHEPYVGECVKGGGGGLGTDWEVCSLSSYFFISEI